MKKITKKSGRACGLLRGRIGLQRQGMGFVKILEDSPCKNREVYIHPSGLNGAWHNDLVAVELLTVRRGKNPEGRVVEILERSLREILVRILPQKVRVEQCPNDAKLQAAGLQPGPGEVLPGESPSSSNTPEDEKAPPFCLARPLDARLAGYVLVDISPLAEEAGDIHAGDILPVVLLPPEKQKKDGLILARAARVPGGSRGRRGLSGYEVLVKAEHNIAGYFPQDVLNECAVFPAGEQGFLPPEQERSGRRDLRRLDFVTIDGQDARDFDDAVYVERKGSAYTLLVAVADAAHYVRAGSALDNEAKARGNSCYFPASVEPMLPEVLSCGLCSLQPGLPRLALVVQMSFSSVGEPLGEDFYPAVIQSKARLTYEEVHAALELKEQSCRSRLSPFLPMLGAASRLAEILFKRRESRGALFFDLPEAGVVLNAEGEVRELLFRKNLSSHKLIEEFMLAANEAVAGYLAALPAGPPFLYRVHPAPDPEKLRDLYRTLAANGLAARPCKSGRPWSARDENPSSDLQAIIGQARDKAEEFVVNRLLLRSMMQARYTPLAEGHFGLASSAYCHFTSPIRRYADLTVHRALRCRLGLHPAQEPLPGERELEKLAESLNVAERNSIEAERDMHKICAALLLARRHKENPSRVYSAVLAGISSFGLYVELTEMPAEGFVPVEELPGDLYRLDAEKQMLLGLRTGAIYRLGQALRLVTRFADPVRREIRFAPEQKPVAPRQEKQPGGRGKSGRGSFPAGAVRRRDRRPR